MQHIISKMSMPMCWGVVLPEFQLRWRDVAKSVRSHRLPMTPSSVASVLCHHAAKFLTDREITEILSMLQLKFVATHGRKWHVIDLMKPIKEDIPMGQKISLLPNRVAQALKSRARNVKTPKVHSVILDDLLYMYVQMEGGMKPGPALYLATPPGYPVALVSSVSSALLKGCVEGLGYKKYEDAQLYGKHIPSLLRIHNENHNENVDHLSGLPEYNPQPVITGNKIDFTNKAYNEKYVEDILGPDPPLLTELVVKSSKPFYDPSRLNMNINLKVELKSKDVAKTLKSWVSKGALAPTSDFFQIFNKVKSNRMVYQDTDSEES